MCSLEYNQNASLVKLTQLTITVPDNLINRNN